LALPERQHVVAGTRSPGDGVANADPIKR